MILSGVSRPDVDLANSLALSEDLKQNSLLKGGDSIRAERLRFSEDTCPFGLSIAGILSFKCLQSYSSLAPRQLKIQTTTSN